MTERKFTDEEVIKALECCKKNDYSFEECKQCPYGGKCYDGDVNFLQDILDLINRQRAELKALKMDNDQLQSDIVNATMNLESVQHELDKARAEIERLKKYYFTHDYHECHNEAIKEFAERLKERHYFHASCVGNCYQMSGNDIDRLVKEMTEDKQ